MATKDKEGDKLRQEDSDLVKKLVDENLKGYAEARLAKLKPRVLDELVKTWPLASDATTVSERTTEQKVTHLLAVKKQLQAAAKKRGSTKAVAPAVSTPISDDRPLPPRKAAVFCEGHSISIVAFNSLKLRLDHPDLKEDWDCAVLEFAKHDVLVLSEVRAGDRHLRTRVYRLIEMLEDCTDNQWAWQMSDPSNGEVHLLIVKRPIDIVKVSTVHAIEGVRLDYAPLVAHIDDLRFAGKLRRFCVTSVHAPPNSGAVRRSQRDAQVSKLLASYPVQADLRLGLPFTNKAAAETRQEHAHVAHILCGDFNASAAELCELGSERHGWNTVFGNLGTSAGGRAYDNFLVNRDAKDHLMLSSHIYQLARFANFSKGEQGLSDHAPIVLTLSELPPRA